MLQQTRSRDLQEQNYDIPPKRPNKLACIFKKRTF
jgi:hypothetical protein